MTNELSILALFGLFTMIQIALAVTLAVPQLGLPYLAGPRDEDLKTTGMAARMQRAAANSVVAMVLFAPAVLALHIAGTTSAATLLAAQIFLIARVVYAPLYWVGIPWLRTGVWSVGFLATAYLYLMLV